ncbi:uncharacterized protein N7482_001495 [Penicillium canariense]|uniref:Uncharacterized protein n=1 Tax=Penicillium canariense TaxID=189055 RepID=A0A9W9IF93_9EURO|nr:uncharacterized protein N7482_001495 [Penicillium canariense]KAJ5175618.1 hypothetical protein N7482_001495 [Penicillium canariense]
MRLHLIISRHGLPATRILWTTTSSPSAQGEYGTQSAASASMVASSRTPNIAFANGGYTVAQLLEDVNEVVPLETEPTMFDPEFSGQWGLEDYVVEVAGSECLHFMEVDGLLRDGDEVVIRALQLADLRARRLCGRHQITSDGKHLIDGVPFGMPFFNRTSSNRPAITIPPRKKRRTMFPGWDHGPAFGYEFANENAHADADEEGDGEWLPPGDTGFGKELSILPPEHEVSDMGTVIRHPVNYSGDTDSEADGSEPEDDELESELKALKEDFEEPASQFIDIRTQGQVAPGPALRSSSVAKRPLSADTQRRSSLVGASSLSSKRSRGDDSSPRASKAVRFNKGEQGVPEIPELLQPKVSRAKSSDSDVGLSSPSSASESSEASSEEEDDDSSEGASSDSSSSDSEDSSSEDDSSESEDDEVDLPSQKTSQPAIVNPPGEGSTRTKKSNQRFKLRRRLSKLKELGVLPETADFATLRAWEEENGGWHVPDETSIMSATLTKAQKKEQEQREFEARRQKLLRDLAAGGVDIEGTSEKENVPPPQQPTATEQAVPKESPTGELDDMQQSTRRTLDVASSRRLLFGSLGVRMPRTKEDEEATRRKLAAKASVVHSRRKTAEKQPTEEEEEESDEDEDWESKLVIKAIECIHDDIELSAPPFPFQQRWDEDADALIRQRKGWGKKRKRKQRIQVYNGDEEGEYEEADGYDAYEDNMHLNYNDEWPTAEDNTANVTDYEEATAPVVDDLPDLPSDLNSVADLLECEAKVGAIIAFRQLDMSKATNWQPQMSGYRVAEVHDVLGNGSINVRLAMRDRRPKADVDPEDDEPREYSGFEMPGMDDEDEEDDGFREVAFAELSDPKLLRPAPWVVDDESDSNGTRGKDKNKAKEGSTVSVVEDSMPNAQLASPPPPVGMDLDETTFVSLDDNTFVTLVTAASRPQSPNESPARASDVPSRRTPGGVPLPHTRGRDADDDHSDTPAVPSPSFSGFHSARSSPGARLGSRFSEIGESNLDGHTLIGDQAMLAVDNSIQDLSTLSFLSANQSFSDMQQSAQHDPQAVDESFLSGANDSLLSVVHNPIERVSAKSSPARSVIAASHNSSRKEGPPQTPVSQENILDMLRSGWLEPDNTDQDRDEADEDLNDPEDHDSVIHSEQSLRLSPQPSSNPPTSAQQEPHSLLNPSTDYQLEHDSPAAATRSKRLAPTSASQPNQSQTSDIIDLTQSPLPDLSQDTHGSEHSQSRWESQPNGDEHTLPQSSGRKTRKSTGKIQHMSEVIISPQASQKKDKKKKRSSRKF